MSMLISFDIPRFFSRLSSFSLYNISSFLFCLDASSSSSSSSSCSSFIDFYLSGEKHELKVRLIIDKVCDEVHRRHFNLFHHLKKKNKKCKEINFLSILYKTLYNLDPNHHRIVLHYVECKIDGKRKFYSMKHRKQAHPDELVIVGHRQMMLKIHCMIPIDQQQLHKVNQNQYAK